MLRSGFRQYIPFGRSPERKRRGSVGSLDFNVAWERFQKNLWFSDVSRGNQKGALRRNVLRTQHLFRSNLIAEIKKRVWTFVCFLTFFPGVYSKPSEESGMEYFTKIVNSIIDVDRSQNMLQEKKLKQQLGIVLKIHSSEVFGKSQEGRNLILDGSIIFQK